MLVYSPKESNDGLKDYFDEITSLLRENTEFPMKDFGEVTVKNGDFTGVKFVRAKIESPSYSRKVLEKFLKEQFVAKL